jgi:ABC-2 type transport system permease protein
MSTPTILVDSTLRVTPSRIAAGEWIKLRSVRSSVATLLGGAIATILFGVVFSLSVTDGQGPPGPASQLTDPASISLGAINLTQLIVGVLGVLVVAGEYATGLIRSTFAAVGSRVGVLTAKAAVVGASVFCIMAVATTIALVAGQAVYTGNEATLSLTDPTAWRVLFGATLYLTGVALMGIALGFILRSTASAIGLLVAGLFVIPNLLNLLPETLSDVVLRYFPSNAGTSMMAVSPGSDLLPVWAGFVVFLVWVGALLAVASAMLRRRDA